MAGGYLPWVNAPENRVPDLIGGIGDTLVAAAQRKQQERQFAAKNLLEKQRLEADQARMRAEESRAQAEEHRAAAAAQREEHRHAAQQADATAAALPQIHQLLEAGDEGSASALAQAHGIKLQQRPLATPDPGAAPGTPPAPGFVGPLETPEQSQQRGMYGDHPGKVFVDQEEAGRASVQGDRDQDPFPTALPHGAREGQWIPDPRGMGPADPAQGAAAMQETQRLQAERQQYAQALADHPKLVAEHQAHLQAYQQAKQNPVYDIQTPYGQSTFDLGAVRSHQQRQQEETAGTIAQGLPPQYALRAAALIKTGMAPVEVSKQIEAQMRADEDRQMRRDIAGGRNETALSVAALRKKPGAGSAAGAGGPSKMELREAGPVMREMDQSLADVTRKGGLAENLQHMQGTLEQLNQSPNNPVVWTNAIDAAIRTNTGRAAIKAQYDLYREHARGAVDSFDSWLEAKKTGNLGAAEKQNFKAAFESGFNEMRGQAKTAYDNFRRYDADPRVKRNKAISEGYQARERNTFGRLPGYGQAEGGKKAPEAAHPAAAPVGETKTLPNGTKVRKVGPNQWEAIP